MEVFEFAVLGNEEAKYLSQKAQKAAQKARKLEGDTLEAVEARSAVRSKILANSEVKYTIRNGKKVKITKIVV
jgi:hypothetical protein